MMNVAKTERESEILQKQVLWVEAHAILQLYQEEKVHQKLFEIIKEDLKLKKLELKDFCQKCFLKRMAANYFSIR